MVSILQTGCQPSDGNGLSFKTDNLSYLYNPDTNTLTRRERDKTASSLQMTWFFYENYFKQNFIDKKFAAKGPIGNKSVHGPLWTMDKLLVVTVTTQYRWVNMSRPFVSSAAQFGMWNHVIILRTDLQFGLILRVRYWFAGVLWYTHQK